MPPVYVPTSKRSFTAQFCQGVVERFEHWFGRFILGPLLVTVLPAAMILFATRDEFRANAIAAGFDPPNWMANPLILLTLAFLYPLIARGVWEGIKSHSNPEREINRDDLLLLIDALHDVVGQKLERFKTEARKDALLNSRPASIFLAITKPHDQIRALVKSVHSLFGALDTSTHFRIGLLEIKEGKPVEWLAYFPDGRVPRTPPNVLASPASTVMRAIKRQETVIVDDIQSELKVANKDDRNYIKGNSDSNEAGSQLCRPIFDPRDSKTIYVLTVAGNRRNCLMQKHLPIYDWLLGQVDTRIQLEHCLKVLRERCNENDSGKGRGTHQTQAGQRGQKAQS